MARYVLLRISDEAELATFLEDTANYPSHDLLTPCQENGVDFDVVGLPLDAAPADLRQEIGRSFEEFQGFQRKAEEYHAEMARVREESDRRVQERLDRVWAEVPMPSPQYPL
jgi:hypothetical protein